MTEIAPSIDTLVFVNNSICADMTRKWLLKENIDLSRVALVLLRKLSIDWADDCAMCIRYPIKPKQTLAGQVHVLGFYRRAARLIKAILKKAPIDLILVPNNDNLLTNHAFRWVERHPDVRMVVVAEGIMNYQNIGYDNRAAWRWRAKVPIAAALGLQYREPEGHLSGAFETGTDLVVSFAPEGLTAPSDKVEILQYPTVVANRPTNPKVALVLHSGLTHWMPSEDFEAIAHGFVNWLKSQEFNKIYAKRHPNVQAGMIEDIMPPHEIIKDSRPFEALLPDLEAGTLAGMCCTALITSKLMRPDLRCVDFGANRYLESAYQGDQTVIKLMSAVGVEMIPLAPRTK